MSTTVAKLVLERLNGRADCQARKHSSRLQVSVRHFPDGTVGVKCFGGCDTRDVIAAEGLTYTQLFPARNRAERQRHTQIRREVDARENAHETRLTTIYTLLRRADALIRDRGQALQFAEQHGLMTDAAWDGLIRAFRLKQALEDELALLNPRLAEIHEIGREAQG